MTWNPPPEVRAAGERLRGTIPNVQGSQLLSDDLTAVQLPIQPGTRALREYIATRWGVPVGAPRGASVRKPLRRADGTLRRRDVHEEGRALDVMSESNRALGEEVANWLALNAQRLGVQYLIFDRLELSSSNIGPAWEPYGTSGDRNQWGRAPNPHTDHVHVELSPSFAGDGAAMRARLGMPARSDANAIEPAHASSTHATTDDTPNTRAGSSSAGADVERVRVFTGPRNGGEWLRSRFELLYLTLRDLGLPADAALWTARAVLALWVSEVGWNEREGAGESCHNPGNITGASPYGFFRIPGNVRRFRAYENETDGVRDAVAVLSTGRYRAAWDALIRGGYPFEWYAAILRAGYTAFAQGLVDEYEGVLRLLPRKVKA